MTETFEIIMTITNLVYRYHISSLMNEIHLKHGRNAKSIAAAIKANQIKQDMDIFSDFYNLFSF
jgi:hypothetical protein